MKHAVLMLLPVLAVSALLSPQNLPVQFSDVAEKIGVTFKHENGASPDKLLPETMSAGVIIFDYNNDGLPDLFFVNGGSFVDKKVAAGAHHRLYRNTGDGKFADVTASSGIGTFGFGMGGCAADYDNDGWPDLYVTAVGGNKLYRNTRNNSFVDVTNAAGVGAGLWSASCAFGDIDNDGSVDLYVIRYVNFAPDNIKVCMLFQDVRSYCHPNVYSSVPDILFRNKGDGTFTDVTKEAGVYKAGNGLGVVFGDYDDDGWIDIYVANDATPNFLFHNKGKGVFEEVGLWSGTAVGIDGKPLAGMGTDMGDVNGDGLLDIFVTNLDGQTHSLYKNLGKGLFTNVTFSSGIAEATLPYAGWGTAFFDYDNDGDLDLAVANGDVLDNAKLIRDNSSYEQLNLLLRNDGAGKLASVGPVSGSGFALKKASRALAVADLDNDGDLDIVVSNVGARADVLQNDGGNRSNSILVRVVGSSSNHDGIGARLKLSVGGKTLVREVKAGSSYLAQNDLRVHFGLGNAAKADRLEIRWPGGPVEVIENIEGNCIVTIRQGDGVIRSVPFEQR
ncbi:MAG TPA: CRTAC1 family protein [Terriglobia bacterium]|nr:CRTAC1 family protein [Terriglobia bacterium]